MAEVRPSELESQVLAVLWERGPSVVCDVQEALPDGKQRAYTTVPTTLQIMEKKASAHTRDSRPRLPAARLPGRRRPARRSDARPESRWRCDEGGPGPDQGLISATRISRRSAG